MNEGHIERHLEFKKIEGKNHIKAIAYGTQCLVTLDDKGMITYKGTKNVGKSAGHPIGGKIKGVKNVKDIFCRGEYIYVLNDKNVYRYKLKR